jgi:tetratricopeptide (TPR) repeat protein
MLGRKQGARANAFSHVKPQPMPTRLRVFVSSTITDLAAARDAVERSLSDVDVFEVVRTEKLAASDRSSRRVCLDEVAAADALVLILGTRYGFVPKDHNPLRLSVTHLEYREARRLSKAVFAFPQSTADREPALSQFVAQIGDFDDGSFLHEWLSVDDLAKETRRALLSWVLRRARADPSQESRRQATADLARYLGREALPVFVESPIAISAATEHWLSEFFAELSKQSTRNLLPRPARIDGTAPQDVPSGVRLLAEPSPDESHVSFIVSLRGSPPSRTGTGAMVPPVLFTCAVSLNGARDFARVISALTLFVVGDSTRSLDDLLLLAHETDRADEDRLRTLEAASLVSAYSIGRRSTEVARAMLELPLLDGPALGAVVAALTLARSRYTRSGANTAASQAEHIGVELLLLALRRGQLPPDGIYNLAHKIGHRSVAALELYSELIRVDPSYDERWYVHRDVGVVLYQSGRLKEAGREYDLAAKLKENDSELWRFAGDAYFYDGFWAEALIRFNRAVALDDAEHYFLDNKIAFTQRRVRSGQTLDRACRAKKRVSYKLSGFAERARAMRLLQAGRLLFAAALRIWPLNFAAAEALALYANRRANYSQAVRYLGAAISASPELPSPRLNLVMNLIFLNRGAMTSDARLNLRMAIFHGGADVRERFQLRLINTPNRDNLMKEFKSVYKDATDAYDGWSARRANIRKPERFGNTMHLEI